MLAKDLGYHIPCIDYPPHIQSCLHAHEYNSPIWPLRVFCVCRDISFNALLCQYEWPNHNIRFIPCILGDYNKDELTDEPKFDNERLETDLRMAKRRLDNWYILNLRWTPVVCKLIAK